MKTEVFTVTGEDGVAFDARICAPEENVRGTVIYVNGSGPNSYNVKRRSADGTFWNYHDFFAERFCAKNIAYCSYSTRGVRDGDEPPFFVEIDEELYKTYLPLNSVGDVLRLTEQIAARYPGKPVWLLGWSEGTIVAPLVALRTSAVTGLFLCGYANEDLLDILKWQLRGGCVLVPYRRLFDCGDKDHISREDYEEDRLGVRELIDELKGKTFDDLDADGDGKLTEPDLAAFFRTEEHLNDMLKAIDAGDDDWLRENHGIALTSGWFRAHAQLEPNKVVLPRLTIPIHIFSGEYDAMTPQFFVRDIEKRFRDAGKTNLTVHYFKDHDHDLNFAVCKRREDWSCAEGLDCIFATADAEM